MQSLGFKIARSVSSLGRIQINIDPDPRKPEEEKELEDLLEEVGFDRTERKILDFDLNNHKFIKSGAILAPILASCAAAFPFYMLASRV